MVKQLKREDFVRFLEAKIQTPRCACCGRGNFALFDEGDVDLQGTSGHAAIPVFPFPDFDVMRARGYDISMIACTNCGAIVPFHRQTILDWIAANPGSPAGARPTASSAPYAVTVTLGSKS